MKIIMKTLRKNINILILQGKVLDLIALKQALQK